MLRNYFGFLSRGEKELLDQIIANLQLSVDSGQHLLALVDFLEAHDYDEALREEETISTLETKADEAHLRLVERICSGSFFGGIREDLLTLLEQIDNIADSAKDSSKLLRQRRIPDEAIDYLFREEVASFIRTCVETANIFKEAVIALGKNKSEVIRLANQVERSEENADAIRSSILENLLKNEIRADPLDIIMLKDFLNIADDVADCAEDGSDALLILVAKGYT